MLLVGVFCLLTSLVWTSCSFFAGQEEVTFELPLWPDYLPQLQLWRVELLQAEDPPLSDQSQSSLTTLSPQAKNVSFKVQKNRPAALLIYPQTGTQFFKPAGTIYPYSKDLTWSGGYAVQLYKRILTSARQSGQTPQFIMDYISSFNWEKLLQTLEEKEAESFNPEEETCFYNPWLLDSQELLDGIAYRNFSATKLKLSDTIKIPLDFEVFSSYVPENAFIKEASLQKNQPCVSVKTKEPALFLLDPGVKYGLLISASSAKNISLEFISLPIYIEEI